MKILVFNPLKSLMKRGIPVYSDEYASLLQDMGWEVQMLEMPTWFQGRSKITTILGYWIYQQLVLPIFMLKHRITYVFDAYNSYSILGALLARRYIYVVHDFIPFERRDWHCRPGSVYMRILHILAPLVGNNLCIAYIAPKIARQGLQYIKKPSVILPNIVEPFRYDMTDILEADLLAFSEKARAESRILLSTISGSGANKDFNGLIEMLGNTGHSISLIAFGFPDRFERTACGGHVQIFSPGRRESNQIGMIIACSHLFVFHSLSEGYGRPLIEALMVGQKVLTSDVSPSIDFVTAKAFKNLRVYKDTVDFKAMMGELLQLTAVKIGADEVLNYNRVNIAKLLSQQLEAKDV